MARKSKDETIREMFATYLKPGETLQHSAYGVKQPNLLLIIVLICMGILPGIIAIALLTKNYMIGMTDKRLIVLTVGAFKTTKVKAVTEYGLSEIPPASVTTSTGGLFTHINIDDKTKPFKAKFHRAYSKTNRPDAMAIAGAISA